MFGFVGAELVRAAMTAGGGLVIDAAP